MKNIYFLADAHLGSLAIPHQRTQERRLVRFLDSIKHKASAIYLLGDMFDFWNEYKYVVPKGFTRFLGKVSELTDMGIEPETVEIYDKIFFLAHGDGLGDPDAKFKFLRKMFHNRTCQKLLNFVHPWWGMQLGLNWAKHSRLKRADGKEAPFMGEDKEYLILFTKEYMKTHSNIDYFIFGHRHIELEMKMSRKTELVILGDWIWQFTYAVFDGEHMFIQQYIEGESKP